MGETLSREFESGKCVERGSLREFESAPLMTLKIFRHYLACIAKTEMKEINTLGT